MRTILFVCSGNYCRSPMAEGPSDLISEQRDVSDPGVQELEPLRQCRDTIDRVLTTGLQEMIQRAGGGA